MFIKIFFGIFSFILGAVMASFGGVVAFRVPQGISIIKPDSKCFSCDHKLAWYDNIPILSWIILRGKCRYCGAKIGVKSLIFEILGGVSYCTAFFFCKEDYWTLFFTLPMLTMLLIISWEDSDTHLITNLFQYILLFFGLGYVIYTAVKAKAFPWDSLIGLGIGFGAFMLIKILALLIAKKDALGTGDVILVSIAGLVLGYKKLLLLLLVASLLGSVVELIKIAVTKKKEEIAFGPYLCLGFYVALVFGSVIIDDFFMGVIVNAII